MLPKISHMLGFVRHDYKFIAPLHPPDPAQSAKPMECEPRASAGAKTPISRNRPVIGVGVVDPLSGSIFFFFGLCVSYSPAIPAQKDSSAARRIDN